jgi:Flp pilus assembly protein TadD
MDERGWPREVISVVKRAEDLILKGSQINLIYACDALDEALDILPRDPILLVTRGQVLMQLGDIENAREDFKKAINLAPDFVPLLLKSLKLDTIL